MIVVRGDQIARNEMNLRHIAIATSFFVHIAVPSLESRDDTIEYNGRLDPVNPEVTARHNKD